MLERSLAPAVRPAGDPALVRRVRRGTRRRTRWVLGGLVVALVLVSGARVLLGDYTVTIPDFLRIVSGQDIPGASFIVMESKLPRALLGAMVGVAFGLGGAIFQATLRNPLASPDILGISVGASAAALVAIIELDLAGLWVSGFAVAGALGVALTINAVAGGIGGNRLVLIGVGLAAALLSVIHYLFTRADVYDAHVALRWLTGSVSAADWPTIRLLALALLVVVPVVAWLARSLPATELGPDTATALGVAPWRSQACCSAPSRSSPSRWPRRDRWPSWRSSPAPSPGSSTPAVPAWPPRPWSGRCWWWAATTSRTT